MDSYIIQVQCLTDPQQISFARTPSDAVVNALNPNVFDDHHKERLVRKSKSWRRLVLATNVAFIAEKSRQDNPLKRKLRLKRLEAGMDGFIVS